MSEFSNVLVELREVHFADGAWHGPGLRKILSGITAEKAALKTVRDYRSIWELVLHISKWEEVFCLRLEGEILREPAEGDWPEVKEQSEAAWQEALEFLDATHTRLIQIISTLSDEDLQKQVAGKDYSIGYMLHGIVRHHVYHAGQIAILKRLN
jgi:uncharacterized damage-inducible protein DinB